MVKNCFFIGKSGAGWGGRERFWQQMCDPLLPYLPQTGSLGWIVEEFRPLRANLQEKASSPPARSCRAHLVPSVWTLHKLRVAWARGRVRSTCRAGPFLNPECWATQVLSLGQRSDFICSECVHLGSWEILDKWLGNILGTRTGFSSSVWLWAVWIPSR